MRFSEGAMCLVTAFGIAAPALADSIAAECRYAIVPDTVMLKKDDSVRLAWLSILEKESFESAKHSAGLEGMVPVDGAPLKARADYGDFSEARDREFSKQEFHYSQDTSTTFLQSKLSVNSLAAYRSCLEKASQTRPGFHMWTEAVHDDSVEVRLFWNLPEHPPLTVERRMIQTINTTPPAGLIGLRLHPAAQWSGLFPREVESHCA